MRVLRVRAGDVSAPTDALIHEDTSLEADRSDVATGGARDGEVGIARELDLAGREELTELRLVDIAVARQHDRDDLA